MKGNAAAQAAQSSRVKPRPVIEKAPKLLQLRLIVVDPDALANVRFGSFVSILACPQHVRLAGNIGNAGVPSLPMLAGRLQDQEVPPPHDERVCASLLHARLLRRELIDR